MNIKLKLLRISVIDRSLECSRIKWYKKYKEGSDYMILNLKDIIFLNIKLWSVEILGKH